MTQKRPHAYLASEIFASLGNFIPLLCFAGSAVTSDLSRKISLFILAGAVLKVNLLKLDPDYGFSPPNNGSETL